MAWFVSALGVALALAGAAAIVSGAPYIQLEWGWTEVIAGTTALSAGIMTLALGAVLFALGGLRRVLMAGAAGLPAGMPVETVLPLAEGDLETEDTATRTHDDGATLTVSDPVAAPAQRRMGRLVPRLRASKDEDIETPSDAQGGRIATGVDTDQPPSPPAAPARDAQDRFAGHRPSIDPASPLRAVATADPDGASPRTFDQGGGPAASSASSPQRDGPPRHSSEAPTVVGRYEAGGASYVLFSDGAIEVESDSGTHRFASMQDLRDHIERQDAVG